MSSTSYKRTSCTVSEIRICISRNTWSPTFCPLTPRSRPLLFRKDTSCIDLKIEPPFEVGLLRNHGSTSEMEVVRICPSQERLLRIQRGISSNWQNGVCHSVTVRASWSPFILAVTSLVGDPGGSRDRLFVKDLLVVLRITKRENRICM